LIRFSPSLSRADFIPPTCASLNESSAILTTATGTTLLQYDLCIGHLTKTFDKVHSTEITSICMDGTAGRRFYVGCGDGTLLLLNFMTGAKIDSLEVHTGEIVSILTQKTKDSNCVYTGGRDGRICLVDETLGSLGLHNIVESAFGTHIPVAGLKLSEGGLNGISVILAYSLGKDWGAWSARTLKRLTFQSEESTILGVDVIRYENITFAVAVALSHKLLVYSTDWDTRTVLFKFSLSYSSPSCVTNVVNLNSVNSAMRIQTDYIACGFEDGIMQIWSINKSKFLEVESSKDIESYSWDAHGDSIVTIVPLEGRSTLISISLDGYQRVWQLQEKHCIGEIALPYQSEEMSKRYKRILKNGAWTLVLNKTQVSQEHINIAHELVSKIKSREEQYKLLTDLSTRRRDKPRPSVVISSNETFLPSVRRQEGDVNVRDEKISTSDRKLARMTALTELRKDQERRMSSFCIPVLQTDQEDDDDNNNNIEISENQNAKENNLSVLYPQVKLSELDSGLETCSSQESIQQKSMWLTSEELCKLSSVKSEQLPKAFSESSLSAARRDGVISGNEFRLLRAIGRDKAKVAAFESSQPSLLLRNPDQTAITVVSRLQNYSQAEIVFGSQAVS
jgi:hypothetical protein